MFVYFPPHICMYIYKSVLLHTANYRRTVLTLFDTYFDLPEPTQTWYLASSIFTSSRQSNILITFKEYPYRVLS